VSFRPDLGNVVQNELQRRMGDILGQQNGENPLSQLGASLFGQRPAAQAPAETPAPPANGATTQAPAATPAPAPEAEKHRTPEEQARDALGGLFRRN
jgi:ribosomal protein L12E/L44/L45/RPP1/RPP2